MHGLDRPLKFLPVLLIRAITFLTVGEFIFFISTVCTFPNLWNTGSLPASWTTIYKLGILYLTMQICSLHCKEQHVLLFVVFGFFFLQTAWESNSLVTYILVNKEPWSKWHCVAQMCTHTQLTLSILPFLKNSLKISLILSTVSVRNSPVFCPHTRPGCYLTRVAVGMGQHCIEKWVNH